jgi:hypothetical protein
MKQANCRGARFAPWRVLLPSGVAAETGNTMKRAIHYRVALGWRACPCCPRRWQAQVQTIDPNSAIDGDLAPQPGTTPAAPRATPVQPAPASPPVSGAPYASPGAPTAPPPPQSMPATPPAGAQPASANGQSWHEDDLIGAAEGVFGKGAKGLAMMIRDILKKQGEPIGYITGREAGGALVVGLRYGSGTLHHKVEGDMPVYWTGPSVGFDAGANAGNTFVLVYNLYDTADHVPPLWRGRGAGLPDRRVQRQLSAARRCRAHSGAHGRGAAPGRERRLHEVQPQADLDAVLGNEVLAGNGAGAKSLAPAPLRCGMRRSFQTAVKENPHARKPGSATGRCLAGADPSCTMPIRAIPD